MAFSCPKCISLGDQKTQIAIICDICQLQLCRDCFGVSASEERCINLNKRRVRFYCSNCLVLNKQWEELVRLNKDPTEEINSLKKKLETAKTKIMAESSNKPNIMAQLKNEILSLKTDILDSIQTVSDKLLADSLTKIEEVITAANVQVNNASNLGSPIGQDSIETLNGQIANKLETVASSIKSSNVELIKFFTRDREIVAPTASGSEELYSRLFNSITTQVSKDMQALRAEIDLLNKKINAEKTTNSSTVNKKQHSVSNSSSSNQQSAQRRGQHNNRGSTVQTGMQLTTSNTARINGNTSTAMMNGEGDFESITAVSVTKNCSVFASLFSLNNNEDNLQKMLNSKLKTNNIQCIEINPNNTNKTYKSFKITADSSFKDQLFSSVTWPNGIMVRPYRNKSMFFRKSNYRRQY